MALSVSLEWVRLIEEMALRTKGSAVLTERERAQQLKDTRSHTHARDAINAFWDPNQSGVKKKSDANRTRTGTFCFDAINPITNIVILLRQWFRTVVNEFYESSRYSTQFHWYWAKLNRPKLNRERWGSERACVLQLDRVSFTNNYVHVHRECSHAEFLQYSQHDFAVWDFLES